MWRRPSGGSPGFRWEWGWTHLPLLVRAVQATTGPVVEIGGGAFSTPILLALTRRRTLFTVEESESWAYSLHRGPRGQHHVSSGRPMEPWKILRSLSRASVVFIDSSPEIERKDWALSWRDFTDFVILHDAEPSADPYYRYSSLYPQFKHAFVYRGLHPHTAILSQTMDPRELIDDPCFLLEKA